MRNLSDRTWSAVNGCKWLGEEQENEWLDLLERFDCKTVPKAKQVKDVILEIAHKEFIQTPRYVVDSWSTPLSALHRGFSSTDSLLEMFARGKPTSKKIISLFDTNPETRAQEEEVSFLKRFVWGIRNEKLTKFLRFCTGSNMACVEKITINFNNLEGAERQPVAHTCGAVLDLSATHPWNGTAYCPQSIGTLISFELLIKSLHDNYITAVLLGIISSPKSG